MKPLWSWRHTVDVISRLSEDTGARQDSSRADAKPLGVLVEHGINDVNKGLVGREEAMAAGEQIAFEPTLQSVLGKHLQDPPVARQLAAVSVLWKIVGQPQFLAHLVDRVEPVRAVFVGAEDPEVRWVLAHNVPQEAAQGTGVLSRGLPGFSTLMA